MILLHAAFALLLAAQISVPASPPQGEPANQQLPIGPQVTPSSQIPLDDPAAKADFTPPKISYEERSEYTSQARERMINGKTVLHMKIDTNGVPQNIRIARPLADTFMDEKDRAAAATLDQAALKAAKNYRFSPAVKDGKPVEAEFNLAISFGIGQSAFGSPLAGDDKPQLQTVHRNLTSPRVIYQVEPDLTPEARKRHLRGISTVALIIDATGKPQNVHILSSMGLLFKNEKDRAAAVTCDDAAIAAVQRYRFVPAMENGHPVPVQLTIEVNFRIF